MTSVTSSLGLAFNTFYNIQQSRPPQTIQSRLLIEWNAKVHYYLAAADRLDGLRPFVSTEKPRKKKVLMEFGNPFKKNRKNRVGSDRFGA